MSWYCIRRRRMGARIRGFTSTSRSIRRCESRDCSSTSPVRRLAVAISSTTRLPKPRRPSCARYRAHTTSMAARVPESRGDASVLLQPLLELHGRIRDAVVRACERQAGDVLSAVADEGAGGDTIYAIDRVGEAVLEEGLADIALTEPLVLVAEGLAGGGKLVLPRGTSEQACRWRLLMDPIDGTRGLMFQKRSAWILTGVAPNRGAETRLRDIVLAAQTEIPLL